MSTHRRRAKEALERRAAQHLLRLVTGEQLEPQGKPDASGTQSRPGGRPDFRFVGSTGTEYFVEVTRLLPSTVRHLEGRIIEHVCNLVSGELPGTFTLNLSYDAFAAQLPTADDAAAIVASLRKPQTARDVGDRFAVHTGIELQKISEEGSQLIPWIEVDDPWDLQLDDPRWHELEQQFVALVAEANRKAR